MTRKGNGPEERILEAMEIVESQIPLDIVPSGFDAMKDRTDVEPVDITQPGHLTKLARRVFFHDPVSVVHMDDDHVPCWDRSSDYRREWGWRIIAESLE